MMHLDDHSSSVLPIPPHFDPSKVGEVWRVHYQERAVDAKNWAREHRIIPASMDKKKVALVGVDIQNTFCIPGFELFVGGRSGMGAVDDNRRLCEFIYRYLDRITRIIVTMDTHHAFQIFHPAFLINARGEHPDPVTLVTLKDVKEGVWKFNPEIADSLGIHPSYGQELLEYYTAQLVQKSKYDLTIWPYHAMLGGIGHALVSSFEEALFFHTIARSSQLQFEQKGDSSLSENYSVIRPEVLTGPSGESLGHKNPKFLDLVSTYDAVLIAGQAKSHCVSFTISDWLADIQDTHPALANKLYILEDCMSPVVVPGIVDYTDQAEAKFAEFASHGIHLVQSSEAIDAWLK